MHERHGLLSFVIILILIAAIEIALFHIDGSAQEPYPPPGTPHVGADQYKIYLPIVFTSRTHFYAQAQKDGEFYGVWATIETADPAIREPIFSYASINIVAPTGQWVETGWIKSPISGCVPKFSWAINPGVANIIDTPRPTIGVPYQYMIEKISDGNWRLRIMETNGIVIVQEDISNVGMDSGSIIQAVGEVDSVGKLNDMGVSGLVSLKWKSQSTWFYWGGWNLGVQDYPPYRIVGVTADPNNNVQISGNNGNPVPPDAPCP